VARGALQVVGHRPVVLVAELVLDELRDHGPDSAELRVAEGVARAGIGEELALGVAHALGDHDGAVAVLFDALLDPARNCSWWKTISGNRMMCGASPAFSAARPPAAAIHPACRPITSITNTLVEVRAIEATSKPASRIDTATYFATEPKPGSSR